MIGEWTKFSPFILYFLDLDKDGLTTRPDDAFQCHQYETT